MKGSMKGENPPKKRTVNTYRKDGSAPLSEYSPKKTRGSGNLIPAGKTSYQGIPLKGAPKGAVKGAVKGAEKGMKMGAKMGAVAGAMKGAMKPTSKSSKMAKGKSSKKGY